MVEMHDIFEIVEGHIYVRSEHMKGLSLKQGSSEAIEYSPRL